MAKPVRGPVRDPEPDHLTQRTETGRRIREAFAPRVDLRDLDYGAIEQRILAQTGAKTPGQLAYETELALVPNYHDGTPRRTWEQLDEAARWSWERDPTPRTKRA